MDMSNRRTMKFVLTLFAVMSVAIANPLVELVLNLDASGSSSDVIKNPPAISTNKQDLHKSIIPSHMVILDTVQPEPIPVSNVFQIPDIFPKPIDVPTPVQPTPISPETFIPPVSVIPEILSEPIVLAQPDIPLMFPEPLVIPSLQSSQNQLFPYLKT